MNEIKIRRRDRPRRHHWSMAAFATAALLTPAAVTLANVPRTPALGTGQPVWLGFFFMFLMAAVVIAVSLMPSKRSHQE